jgi:RNA polymerase sigma-70 factor (sigma-E family)
VFGGESEEEFSRFVEKSAERLVRTAYLVVGDFAEAEDLSQEALARVACRWRRVRRMESPYGYARRVLFHLALREKQRRRGRPIISAQLPEIAVGDEADSFALQDALMAAISLLPTRQRVVLVLRYWEQLTEAETAELLGCSVGTVKSQASKAIERLRRFLREPAARSHSLTKERISL